MRIIAGKWRGRRIEAPDGLRTRPILDRAKTVLFDMLGHRLDEPGRLPPLAVLDLFAGSGALGLEAVSRGARFALLVENHRPTAQLLRRNLVTLQIVDEARVEQGNAATCRWPEPPGEGSTTYGLVFVDPPYPQTRDGLDPIISQLLDRLLRDPAIAPDALIVFRHEYDKHSEPDLSPLIKTERREVGSMVFRFLRRPLPEGATGENANPGLTEGAGETIEPSECRSTEGE